MQKNINLNLFALESADPFIAKTEFEGHNPAETARRFQECLEASCRESGIDLSLDLKGFYEEANKMARLGSPSDMNRYADELCRKVKALQRGEELYLPGGWMNEGGGHAMIYRIARQQNGKFSFTLYNTGLGLKYHEASLSEGERKFRTVLIKEGVTEGSLCRPVLFRGIAEIMAISFISSQPSRRPSEKSIYKGILNCLDGNYLKEPSFGFMTPQRSGTCSMRPFFALLRHLIIQKAESSEAGLKRYKRLKFYYKRQSLADIRELYKERAYCRKHHKLISEVACKWARNAKKLPLTEEELRDCEATVREIRQELKQKKRAAKREARAVSYSLGDARFSEVYGALFNSGGSGTGEWNLYQNRQAYALKPLGLPSDKLPPLDRLSTMAERLEGKNLNKIVGLAAFEEFARTLPVPKRGERDCWDAIPETEIESHLAALRRLSESAHRHYPSVTYGHNVPLSFATIAGQYTLLAIGDKLARRLPNKQTMLKGERIDYYPLIGAAQHQDIALLPADHKRAEQLLDYFNDQFDLSKTVNYNKKRLEALFVIVNPELKKGELNKYGYFRYLQKFATAVRDNRLTFLETIARLLTDRHDKGGLLPPALRDLEALVWNAKGTLPYPHFNGVQKACHQSPGRVPFFGSSASFIITDSETYRIAGNSASSMPQNKLIKAFLEEENRDNILLKESVYERAARTLAYYEERPLSLLKKKEQKENFLKRLFYPRSLFHQLRHEPQFAGRLLQFFGKNLDSAIARREWELAAFFAFTGHLCGQLAKKACSYKGERDFRRELLEEVAAICPNRKARKRVLQLTPFLHSFLERREAEKILEEGGEKAVALAVDLLTHSFIETPLSSSASDALLTVTIEKLFTINPLCRLTRERILHLLTKDPKTRDALLCRLASRIKGETVDTTFCAINKEHTLWECCNRRYLFDFNRDSFSEEGKTFAFFTGENSALFKGIRETKQDENGVWHILDANGEYQMNGSRVLRKMEGKWYTLINNASSINWPLQELPKRIAERLSPPLWRDEEKIRLEKEGAPPYFIFLKKAPDSGYNLEISEDEAGSRLLVPPPKWLTQFEEEKEILCWKSKGGRLLDKIEFPRYGLAFDIRQGKAHCRQFPCFFIAEDQEISIKGRGREFLILENGEGGKRALLPCPGNLTASGKKELFSYLLEEREEGAQLTADSTEGSLYLFYQLLEQRRFKQAEALIKRCRSLCRYTKKETALILSFINDAERLGHPSAKALLLKLSAMVEENALKHYVKNPLLKNERYKPIYDAYCKYLENRDNSLKIKLEPEEEKTLLRFLIRAAAAALKEKQRQKKIEMSDEEAERAVAGHPLLTQRLKLLTGKGDPRPVSLPPAESRRKPLDSLPKPVDFYWHFLQPPQEINALPYLTIQRNELAAIYPSLYKMAQSGTADEREKAKSIALMVLSSESIRQSPESVQMAKFLIEVANSRLRFLLPSAERIVACARMDSNSRIKQLLYKLICMQCHFKCDNLLKLTGLPNLHDLTTELEDLHRMLEDLPNALKKDLPKVGENETAGKSGGAWNPSLTRVDGSYDAEFLRIGRTKNPQNELAALIEKGEREQKRRKKEVEEKLNRLPEGLQERLEHLGQKRRLNLEGGAALLMAGELESELEEGIGLYALAESRLEQARRALSVSQKLAACNTPDEKRTLKRLLQEELAGRRAYHGVEGEKGYSLYWRLYLGFEMRNRLLLRPMQAEELDWFAAQNFEAMIVLMLGTGSGKSKVLGQLKQKMRRLKKEKRLLFNLWPSPLYPVNRSDIKRQVEKSFNQRADSFECSRNDPLSGEALTEKLRRLLLAAEEGRQLNARPESLQAFELKFLEYLYNSVEGRFQLDGETVSLFQNILTLFAESEAHVDEGHKNFSPRREENFTIGNPVTVDPREAALIEKLYRLLLTPELAGKVRLRENEQHLMPRAYFDRVAAPRLAEALAGELKIKEEQREEYLAYVLGKKEKLPEWLGEHECRELIDLLKGELCLLLPETLKRSSGVHYGFSKENPQCEHAIKYEGVDAPIENTEIDNVHERINKTYQSYLCSGLSCGKIWRLLEHLKESALEEAHLEKKEPNRTEAYRTFEKLFPEEMRREKGLFSLFEEDLERWRERVNQNPETIFYYVANFVVPAISQYPHKLRSDAQSLRTLLGDVMTMSATPGPAAIYAKELHYRGDPEKREQALRTIKSKCSGKNSIFAVPGASPRAALKEILAQAGTKTRMLIDVGALFKGISNREAAEIILEQSKRGAVKGVLFFDERDRMMVLDKEGGLLPVEACRFKRHEIFAYCDQKHMFGADIKLPPDAEGICTFDTFVDLDDMLQSSGRLRELSKSQGLRWALAEKSRESLCRKGEELDIALLCSTAEKNQKEREKEDAFRALKQQMRNELRSLCMKKLLGAPPKETPRLFTAFRPLLVDETLLSPSQLYGGIVRQRHGREILEDYRLKLIEKLELLPLLNDEEKSSARQNLEGYREKILEAKLPEKRGERDTELETESEVQQSTETETETENETVSESGAARSERTPFNWSESCSLYGSSSWLSPPSALTLRVEKLGRLLTEGTMGHLRGLRDRTFCVVNSLMKVYNSLPSPLQIMVVFAYVVSMIVSCLLVEFALFYALISFISYLPYSLAIPAAAAGSISLCFLSGLLSGLRGAPPLYRAGDLLADSRERAIREAAPFFADREGCRLRMTNNFICRSPHVLDCLNSFAVAPLGPEQKKGRQLLIVWDENEEITAILGDQTTDARFWRKKLEEDREKTAQEEAGRRTRRIFLYDLALGAIVQEGKNPIDRSLLESSERFRRLILLAKLYNAEVAYSYRELDMIREMIQTPADKEKFSAFFRRALLYRDVKRAAYPGSRIKTLLEKTKKPEG